ncbi:MAG: hypothetical protein ACAF41_11905 [Leptolyngbya sp. BL-A-14]
MSQTTLTTKTTDDRVLYGSNDPAFNLATVRAAAMTEDQLYQAGFDAAFNGRGMRGSLADYPAYLQGRIAGRAARF